MTANTSVNISDSMNAFVYHNGALGDFITTIPAIQLWKKITTPEHVTFFGNRITGEFAFKTGIIDTVWDNCSSRYLFLYSEKTKTDKMLSVFSNFLLFIAPDSTLLNKISNLSPKYFFYQKPFPETPVHVVDYHLSLFNQYIETDKAIIPGINLPISDTSFRPDNNYICICPGSGSRIKNWPFSRFLEIAGIFREKGISIIWICGPAEEYLSFPPNDLIIMNADLVYIASILSKCKFYIGNDSGITHLAAVAGCTTIALFGPSDPQIWSPRGPEVIVLYKKRTCSPCHANHTTQSKCDQKCLLDLQVEDVISVIQAIS